MSRNVLTVDVAYVLALVLLIAWLWPVIYPKDDDDERS